MTPICATIGDVCTAGVCVGVTVDCSGLDDVCNIGVCNATTGVCQTQPANDGGSCDDNDACTENDACAAGSCVGTPILGCQLCATAADCDDGNPCTDVACPAGTCEYANNTAMCDDGDPCTTGDVCAAGSCAPGSPVDCSGLDGACTVGVLQRGHRRLRSAAGQRGRPLRRRRPVHGHGSVFGGQLRGQPDRLQPAG